MLRKIEKSCKCWWKAKTCIKVGEQLEKEIAAKWPIKEQKNI